MFYGFIFVIQCAFVFIFYIFDSQKLHYAQSQVCITKFKVTNNSKTFFLKMLKCMVYLVIAPRPLNISFNLFDITKEHSILCFI